MEAFFHAIDRSGMGHKLVVLHYEDRSIKTAVSCASQRRSLSSLSEIQKS